MRCSTRRRLFRFWVAVTVWGLLFGSLSACLDPLAESPPEDDGDDSTPGKPQDGGEWTEQANPWAIVVMATDYFSSSVSVLDRERGRVFRENIVHSGSASSGLSVALSGDVVFPRSPNPYNWIVLIDRYPNSVLTFVDPESFTVIGQLNVSTGFASNPRDFLWISERKAYVTRYERNLRPGRQRFDGGDDILIVDPIRREIIGRLALHSYADTEESPLLQARPSQMLRAKGLVWVVLEHLSTRFDGLGEGLVLGIDPSTDEVVARVRLAGATNCTALVYSPGRDSLYVSCSGSLLSTPETVGGGSSIVQVDLAPDAPGVSLFAHGDGIDKGPFGFDLDIAHDRWLFAVRFGSLRTGRPDRLVVFDLESGEERDIHQSATAFGLGGLLVDEEMDRVYIGEADPAAPMIFQYTINKGSFPFRAKENPSSATGLPPRHIRLY